MCATCPADLILLDLITRKIFREDYQSWNSSLRIRLYYVYLKPKYLPQHPVLEHSQPTFLCQCERSRFTPLQNNRKDFAVMFISALRYLVAPV
jgi:hypothetical protein